MSFLSRYKELGETFSPKEINIKPAIRINTLKKTAQEIIKRLEKKGVKLTKIPFLEDGYWYESEFSLGATPEYLQGYYYLQETASQIPPTIINPKSGETILDMASAPGSKTTQIAQIMNDEGIVIALDSDANRLSSLKNNLERLGIKSVICYKKDARFAFDLGIKFDKVLLDAPCSGNFCIEKDYFIKKTMEGIKQRTRLQKELIKAAVKVLKTKGTLVYSTCSLEPEENELIIDWLVKKYPFMKIQDIDKEFEKEKPKLKKLIGDEGLTNVFGKNINPEIKKTKRFWPHKTKTQGFFIAKLRKEEEE